MEKTTLEGIVSEFRQFLVGGVNAYAVVSGSASFTSVFLDRAQEQLGKLGNDLSGSWLVMAARLFAEPGAAIEALRKVWEDALVDAELTSNIEISDSQILIDLHVEQRDGQDGMTGAG